MPISMVRPLLLMVLFQRRSLPCEDTCVTPR
jgi:hypothetical protein